MKFQLTMFSKKHKPVACIIEADSRVELYNKGKAYHDAVKKICTKRGWSSADLKRYGYDTFAVMKIEQD